MNKCKDCSANPIVCEYCIDNKKDTKASDSCNEKIIAYNNEQDDNTTKKICPICKKVYTDYPATSRIDNKTLICSKCGMKEIQEPFEELLTEYGFEIVEY